MHHCTDDTPVCRGCGRKLQGSPYFKGGRAYVPAAHPRGRREPAKVNYFGGWVCSEICDRRASLEQERSMPGHGDSQARLGQSAARHLISNWSEA